VTRRLRLVPLALAMLAAPAAGQLRPEVLAPEVRTGSRLAVKPRVVDEDRAALIRFGFARCMYRANPRAAASLLENSDPAEVDLQKAGIKDLGDAFKLERCLGDEALADQDQLGLRMPRLTMRLMLAEQAYLAARPTPPQLTGGLTEQIDRPYVSEGEKLVKAQGVGAFSDCVVFHNAAGADALVRTPPGSEAERVAARSLAPALGSCLTEGQEVALNVRSIRQFVADGLWNRFARAAKR
jgi:hypothetical protein